MDAHLSGLKDKPRSVAVDEAACLKETVFLSGYDDEIVGVSKYGEGNVVNFCRAKIRSRSFNGSKN